ncbi:MAG: DUF3857 and transglutaminase domain-containing protein [Candidatus Hydrothermae bacterium]|nr:DUF3857 and transglutaminase domain-containing protein [Candidatus Hydrothermae bacterium]
MRRFLFLFLALTSVALSHKVYLYDGEEFRTERLLFDGKMYVLDDTVFPSGLVKRVIFEKKRGAAPEKRTVKGEIRKVLDRAEEARRLFPDASLVCLLDKGVQELREDGTRTYRYHFQGLIVKPEKLNAATVLIPFEEDLEKVKVLLARTIKPDGRVINLHPEEIKITKASSGSVFFGREKHLSFTLPEVAPGDVIEYIYEDYVFNPWDRKVFDPEWYFGGEDPVLHSEITIVIPAEQKLKYVIKHDPDGKIRHAVDEGVEINRYFFHPDSVPQVVEEPLMPPVSTVVPSLHASNQENWDYIFDWYAAFQRERMEVTPEIKALADSLVSGAESEDDSIARIYHWVQRNIRYISIKGAAASGVSGHPAWETLKNGYGDCTDKSILFSTLLRAVGIEAYPVYIETNDSGELIPEIPGFQGNHCITEIFKKDGTNLFLDATGTTSRYPSFWSADHGCWAVNALKREIEKIPVPPPPSNLRSYCYVMELDRSGNLHVRYRSSYRGDWEDGVRWYWEHVKESEIGDRFREMLGEIAPDVELISYKLNYLHDISKPFSIELEYRIRNYMERAGDLLLLRLPEIEDRYRFREVSLKTRKYDIFYGTSAMIVDEYLLKFPERFKLEYVPGDTILKFKGDYFKLSAETKPGEVFYRDVFFRPDARIEVGDYDLYRAFCRGIQKSVKRPLVFREVR